MHNFVCDIDEFNKDPENYTGEMIPNMGREELKGTEFFKKLYFKRRLKICFMLCKY